MKKRTKSKYSKSVVREICKNIASGLSAKDSAQMSGVAESTFHEWCRPLNADGSSNRNYHPELTESLNEAVIKRKRLWLKAIRTDKSWQSRAWLLERIHKDEFSTRKEELHSGKLEQAITVSIMPYIPHGATPEQLSRIKEAYGTENFTKAIEAKISERREPQFTETKPLLYKPTQE